MPTRPSKHHAAPPRPRTDKVYEARRGTAAERGYDSRWRKARDGFLRKHPLCAECERNGRITAATVVDHIIPHRGDMVAFWKSDNWGPLCRSCHSIKTAGEDGGFGNVSVYPEWLPIPSVPLRVVLGPPGSGKSTYVREHAKPDALVLDLDDMIAGMTGRPLYERDTGDVTKALRVRNRLLAELANAGHRWPEAWLIVTKGKNFWSRYAASVHLMNTSLEVCRERIKVDDRRSQLVKEQHLAVVNQWHPD